MKKVVNECVGCKSIGLHCVGAGCPNRAVEHFYCDKCKEEKPLYEWDAGELCIDCIEELLYKVEGSGH